MAIEGLTPQQSDFVERFLKVPKVFNRKAAKQRRRAAAEQFRRFNAERDLLRAELDGIADAELRSVLKAQLGAAEEIIERDPDALDFEGGHQHLEDVRQAMLLHVRTKYAKRAFAQMQTSMARLDKDHPAIAVARDGDAQSDIALTWAFVQDKMERAGATGSIKELDAALRAMGRLHDMLRSAETAAQNPFEMRLEEIGDAAAKARASLKPEVVEARRQLSQTHAQLDTLQSKLEAQFGADGIPLALRMGCTATRKKLDDALTADAADLPDLAEDAADNFAAVNKEGQKLIAAAQDWTRDHAAFRVRYEVMLAHPVAKNAMVKPTFDQITATYLAVTQTAASHKYAEACRDIAVLRNDLKDALDIADDHTRYLNVLADRKALLATLPSPADYPVTSLREYHADAFALLDKARTARSANQMSAALGHLNAIPKAVEDILEINRFATNFKAELDIYAYYLSKITKVSTKGVTSLIAGDLAYAEKVKSAAQKDFDEGAYRSAAGRMLSLRGYMLEEYEKARLVATYLAEKKTFLSRRRETRDRKGAGGRTAIEAYYQGLVGDEAKRKTAAANGDFRLALAMCKRLKPQHAHMMRTADDAATYLAKKAAFDAELVKLSPAVSANAQEAKDTADAMLANAVAATVRGNWLGGASLLDAACLEIKRAVSDAQTAALIDGVQDQLELTADTDFDQAYKAFGDILSHVTALDEKGRFAKLLAAADDKARSAQGQIAQDAKSAQETLQDAAAWCLSLGKRATAAASFDAQRLSTARLIADAKAAASDKVIDPEIAAAEQAMKDADAAAKEPSADFAGAVAHLAKAQAQARQGLDAMADYTSTIKEARRKMAQAIAAYKGPDLAADMSVEADQIQAILDQMNSDFTARRLSDAALKAEEGCALAALQADMCESCNAASEALFVDLVGQEGIELTHPMTTREAAEMARLTVEAKDAFNAGQFRLAQKIADQAYIVMWDAREKAERFDAYLPVKITCESALTALESRTVAEAGPGHDAVLALRRRFDAAVQCETLENYNGAAKRLTGFEAVCDAAKALLDTFDAYLAQKNWAQAALARVAQIKSRAMEPLLVRLEGKDRNADRKGQSFDFDIGTSLYAELEAECAIAEESAQAVEDFAAVTAMVKVIAPDDASDLRAAIAEARNALAVVQGRASALYVHAEITDARALLDAAESSADDDMDAGRIKLNSVIDSCLEMTLLMGQYEQLENAALLARSLGNDLLARAPASDLVRGDIEQRLGSVDLAIDAARQARTNRALSQSEIEAAITALRDLRRIVDAHASYLAARAPIETRLTRMDTSMHRFLIHDDLIAARRHLDTAGTRATEHNHPSAEKELGAAGLRLDLAQMRANLSLNQVPDVRAFDQILKSPDGMDGLDEVIDSLEASVQRRVMAVAFEARFGCKLEMQKPTAATPQQDEHGNDLPLPTDEHGNVLPGPDVAEDAMNLPALNLRRFYKEMMKLPPSNTLDNDSMIGFLHLSGKQRGSEFDDTAKKVLMREGDESSSRIYAIAVAHEIGELDPRAVPKPGQERTAFSWNTLHEVGHAVDDKLGYMKKHGERLAGWKVYGASVGEPAKVIADAFKFDADYVAEYMVSTKGRVLAVPKPKGCSADEWQRRMQECRNFVDRARWGNDPWNSASISAACAIGEHTYVESYEGHWTRYRTAERKYAVSGYQFRAPGEWFSEIYAALCTDRLNSNHPHRAEFAKICLRGEA